MSTQENWYDTHSELVTFARVLLDAGEFDVEDGDGAALLAFFEKPWKWEPEHAAWIALGAPLDLEDSEALRADQPNGNASETPNSSTQTGGKDD